MSTMKKEHIIWPAVLLFFAIALLYVIRFSLTGFFILGDPPISESDSGFGGDTRGENYETLVDGMYANGNVTRTVDGKLWVPWFSSSSACGLAQLKSGNGCNLNTINFDNNCMVTDELSQVGILLSMSSDQNRMDQFYNTIEAIPSSFGKLPSWKVALENGNTITACKSGINGNCDSASDADARVIIALFNAANNTNFASSARTNYRNLALDIAEDFVTHDLEKTCRSSSLGHGDICYWLAAGPRAKSGGLGTTDFAYTGYYPDAIIAMLQTCSQTSNLTYCAIASNLSLNYLEAAKFDGSSFSVSPGRSFRWVNLEGIPEPECTYGCNPIEWDDADAPRAIGLCQVPYYAALINYTMPSSLINYCNLWETSHMNGNSVPVQFYPNGSASKYQSGYFAKGLASLFHLGDLDSSDVETNLDSAFGHYSTSLGTWDNTACFGIYHQAFAIRSLGNAIGRDIESFSTLALPLNSTQSNNETDNNSTIPENNSTNSTNNTNVNPAIVTNLRIDQRGNNFIYWKWSNPSDSDFLAAIVYLNGVYKLDTAAGFYNATGLTANTTYILRINTKDASFNINGTNVTLSGTTLALSSSNNSNNSTNSTNSENNNGSSGSSSSGGSSETSGSSGGGGGGVGSSVASANRTVLTNSSASVNNGGNENTMDREQLKGKIRSFFEKRDTSTEQMIKELITFYSEDIS